MYARIATVGLAMLSLAYGIQLTNAAETIFPVNRARVFQTDDVQRIVAKSENPEQCARYIARTDEDDRYEFRNTDLTIGELLAMNTYSTDEDCSGEALKRREEECSYLEGGFQLYCEACLVHVIGVCFKDDDGGIEKLVDTKRVREFKRSVERYAKATGLDAGKYTMRRFVIDYIYSLGKRQTAEIENWCNDVAVQFKRYAASFKLNFTEFANSKLANDGDLRDGAQYCFYVLDGKFASDL